MILLKGIISLCFCLFCGDPNRVQSDRIAVFGVSCRFGVRWPNFPASVSLRHLSSSPADRHGAVMAQRCVLGAAEPDGRCRSPGMQSRFGRFSALSILIGLWVSPTISAGWLQDVPTRPPRLHFEVRPLLPQSPWPIGSSLLHSWRRLLDAQRFHVCSTI
jgi:hypothetical protein